LIVTECQGIVAAGTDRPIPIAGHEDDDPSGSQALERPRESHEAGSLRMPRPDEDRPIVQRLPILEALGTKSLVAADCVLLASGR
jgi:hypothetical protein